MTNLSNYYHFKIRLCQPRKGNEKDHLERSVEFIKRKACSCSSGRLPSKNQLTLSKEAGVEFSKMIAAAYKST